MSEEYKNIEYKLPKEDLSVLERNKDLIEFFLKNPKIYETFRETMKIIDEEDNGTKVVSIKIS
jgi:2-hydroxy-3-keto-5-methylthiopentenyl-1-phosphate phosphatase